MANNQAINTRDLFSIQNKVALVTGGSRGIGRMIAQGYLEAGAKVYISSRKKDVCNKTAEELSDFGTCVSIPGDISSEQGIKELAAEISKREKALHILVNNAGATWGKPLSEYPVSGYDKVMDTNVKGIFFLTRELVPLLKNAAQPGDPARVINIGSIDAIKVPVVENFAYSISKAAVHYLTKVLALELPKSNISCNAIAPGPFESQMTEWLFDNMLDAIVEMCPLKRIGNPSDMAGLAIFLASRAGAYLNGTVIPIDGGLCLK
ncbi:SDR family oxidoreductase [bacterium]|nr:SDR family oxidoreductase [bacterium]